MRIVGGLATIDNIIAVTPGFKLDLLPLGNDWQAGVNSTHNAPITIYVDHWDAQTGPQRSPPITVKAVQAQVTGVIYYWDLSQGQMQRIDSAGRALAIPNPPPRLSSGTSPVARSAACTASRRDADSAKPSDPKI